MVRPLPKSSERIEYEKKAKSIFWPIVAIIISSIGIIAIVGYYAYSTLPVKTVNNGIISQYLPFNLSQLSEGVYTTNQTLRIYGQEIPMQIILKDNGDSIDIILYTQDLKKTSVLDALSKIGGNI